MADFVPTQQYLHEVLILQFHLKKSALQAHREITAVYGEQCIEKSTCRERFAQFKKGNFAFQEEKNLDANRTEWTASR
uniref:HTH_48 domain-containing protein n=1 Tax=Anopheles stephensi TaxID=30069 RepID=A0A182Y2U4_ANOST